MPTSLSCAKTKSALSRHTVFSNTSWDVSIPTWRQPDEGTSGNWTNHGQVSGVSLCTIFVLAEIMPK